MSTLAGIGRQEGGEAFYTSGGAMREGPGRLVCCYGEGQRERERDRESERELAKERERERDKKTTDMNVER